MTKRKTTSRTKPKSNCETIVAVQDVVQWLERLPADARLTVSLESQFPPGRAYIERKDTQTDMSVSEALAKLREVSKAYAICDCSRCRLGRREARAVRRARRQTS